MFVKCFLNFFVSYCFLIEEGRTKKRKEKEGNREREKVQRQFSTKLSNLDVPLQNVHQINSRPLSGDNSLWSGGWLEMLFNFTDYNQLVQICVWNKKTAQALKYAAVVLGLMIQQHKVGGKLRDVRLPLQLFGLLLMFVGFCCCACQCECDELNKDAKQELLQ